MEPSKRTDEHAAVADDKNLPPVEAREDAPNSLKAKNSLNENADDRPAEVDPMEALGDPDWRAKDRQLVRRLDCTFMPVLWILYFHNYLDRNNIA